MKKFFAVLLALAVCLFCFSALCEESATPSQPVAGEGEILMHGYISEAANYYVGVPATWALLGASSHEEHIAQAEDILGYSEVKSIRQNLSSENDILFAFSADGEQMVLNYGPSDGVTSDVLIKRMGELQSLLKTQYKGITFKEDSGSYTLKEIISILYIGAEYNGNDIDQYYMPVGESIYVFTFVNVEDVYRQAVFSTFHLDP